ncbi:MAG: hypothetical protein HKP10_07415 [Kiritimatiellales bacterium]|nr:hypothetical protein [Kiritimatiellales bacterium]
MYLLAAVLFVSFLPAFGGLTDDELKQFKSNLEIGGVRTDTEKDDGKKLERLEVNTYQNEDDPLTYEMSRFRLRLIVELTDKDKNTYLVKFTGNAPEDFDSEYQGEDYWNLYMEHGDFDRLKISGYIVQYGIMDGETFVPLADDEDDAEEMLERVRQRTTALFPGKFYLRHYYMYDDPSEGVRESVPKKINSVKE